MDRWVQRLRERDEGALREVVEAFGERITAVVAGVLRDRDEILIPGLTRCYFSTEEPARVEPFPAGEGPVFCARCRQPIQPATPAVRCPACTAATRSAA